MSMKPFMCSFVLAIFFLPQFFCYAQVAKAADDCADYEKGTGQNSNAAIKLANIIISDFDGGAKYYAETPSLLSEHIQGSFDSLKQCLMKGTQLQSQVLPQAIPPKADINVPNHGRGDSIVISKDLIKDLRAAAPANNRYIATEELVRHTSDFKAFVGALKEAAADKDNQYTRDFAEQVLAALSIK